MFGYSSPGLFIVWVCVTCVTCVCVFCVCVLCVCVCVCVLSFDRCSLRVVVVLVGRAAYLLLQIATCNGMFFHHNVKKVGGFRLSDPPKRHIFPNPSLHRMDKGSLCVDQRLYLVRL